jgi:pimeloyl-ACP methyl ester carboxylesterase
MIDTMISRTIPLALLLLAVISALWSPDAQARSFPMPDSAEVTVMTPDSLELVGYLYLPNLSKTPKFPLVILLHGAAEDHSVWRDFTDLLCSYDFAVFAMDLRGYGYSIYDFRWGKNRPQGMFYVGDFLKYPNDVALLLRQLFAKQGARLDSTKFGIIGAELGANTAMLFAASEPRVKFTGLISPGLELNELRIAPAIKDFGDRPLFITTASKDIYSMQSCMMLSDVVPRVLDIKVFDTFRHGVTLVLTEPELMQILVNKLQQYLK